MEELETKVASQHPNYKSDRYMVGELTEEIHKLYKKTNTDLKPVEEKFSHYHVDVLVVQKNETIVIRNTGRKILKFNVVDAKQVHEEQS